MSASAGPTDAVRLRARCAICDRVRTRVRGLVVLTSSRAFLVNGGCSPSPLGRRPSSARRGRVVGRAGRLRAGNLCVVWAAIVGVGGCGAVGWRGPAGGRGFGAGWWCSARHPAVRSRLTPGLGRVLDSGQVAGGHTREGRGRPPPPGCGFIGVPTEVPTDPAARGQLPLGRQPQRALLKMGGHAHWLSRRFTAPPPAPAAAVFSVVLAVCASETSYSDVITTIVPIGIALLLVAGALFGDRNPTVALVAAVLQMAFTALAIGVHAHGWVTAFDAPTALSSRTAIHRSRGS